VNVDDLERIWKESVMPNFKILSRHSPGGMRKTTKNLNQDSRKPGLRFRDLNMGPPEYEAGIHISAK
jgi:hypothetical protein